MCWITRELSSTIISSPLASFGISSTLLPCWSWFLFRIFLIIFFHNILLWRSSDGRFVFSCAQAKHSFEGKKVTQRIVTLPRVMVI